MTSHNLFKFHFKVYHFALIQSRKCLNIKTLIARVKLKEITWLVSNRLPQFIIINGSIVRSIQVKLMTKLLNSKHYNIQYLCYLFSQRASNMAALR